MFRIALFCMMLIGMMGLVPFIPYVPYAYAQVTGSTTTNPLTVDVNPEYPAPYQTITITPSSTVFDMADATVSVTLNGTNVYTGSGGQDIPVQLGGPGSTNTIVVTATSAGQPYSQTITLHPASVALVTEGVSTTHPFYEGGALVNANGSVRLIAIPDLETSSGEQLDPSQLEYTWKLGDQVLEEDSGIGKDVLIATAPPQYQDATVSVTVQNQDQTLIAQAQTTISAVNPLTLIYNDDPLMGPNYDSALGNSITMPAAEETYIGVPYYFTNPTVSWTVNGSQSTSDPDITVRSSGTGAGEADLAFTATDQGTSATANSTVSVVFGTTSSGLFGL